MEQHTATKVIKLILDHKEVQQYLHPEISNRIPVKIVTNNLVPLNVNIEKHGEAVILTDKAATEPFFEINKYITNDNTIIFNLSYEEEGITISGEANTGDNEVKLISFDVIEN